MLCTYHLDPVDSMLDRERLYQELSQLTHGVTRLGSYTLDPSSLYVSGEQQPAVLCFPCQAFFIPSLCPCSCSFLSSCFLQVTPSRLQSPQPAVSTQGL